MKGKAKPPSVFDVAPQDAGGWLLRRDGAAYRTPAGRDFVLPTRALAERVAEEARAQPEARPAPDRMPLLRLAATALDIVAPDQAGVAGKLAALAEREMLCQRGEEDGSPARAALARRQDAVWQPFLDWSARRFGVVWRLHRELLPGAQDAATVARFEAFLRGCDAFRLTGLRDAVDVTGSLVLALALAEGESDAGAVFQAAELESLFQAERWGEDPLAQARHADIRSDLETLTRWFALLRDRPEE